MVQRNEGTIIQQMTTMANHLHTDYNQNKIEG